MHPTVLSMDQGQHYYVMLCLGNAGDQRPLGDSTRPAPLELPRTRAEGPRNTDATPNPIDGFEPEHAIVESRAGAR